jgi:VIT1/CCC1 family predicted Fe2+/Mn2+ transporter
MAAGEYVSVQSQADTEAADLRKEKYELESDPEHELEELAALYVTRGLDRSLALLVASRLMASDALGAHAREELGITETLRARPVQAACASAVSFVSGAIVPVATAVMAPAAIVTAVTSVTALVTLAILGGAAAKTGGAPIAQGALRVAFWGALAMGLTAAVGRLFGTA